MMATEQRAKGSTLRTSLEFVSEAHGPEAMERALQRLDPTDRSRVEEAELTSEVPFDLLRRSWESIDAELAAFDPDWIERAGAHSIRSAGVQLYGGIMKKSSPLEFLTQRVSLFRLYYQPGNMEVVDSGPTSAALRLVGFDPITPLFCRRQTGGLGEVIAMAGGTGIRCEHVRCALEGDAFCEWSLGWRMPDI